MTAGVNAFLFVCAFLALLVSSSVCSAESAGEAIEAFGLVGTWSPDCSRDMSMKCDIDETVKSMNVSVLEAVKMCEVQRITFAVPTFGKPTETINTNLTQVAPIPNSSTRQFESATRITAEKIKLTYIVQAQAEVLRKFAYLPQDGESWQLVLEKVGGKIKPFSTQRGDGRKISVKDGFIYEHPTTVKIGETQPDYVNTGRPAALLEKCLR
jgi:hypothetical protein